MPAKAPDQVQLAMPPGGEQQARAFYRDLLGDPVHNLERFNFNIPPALSPPSTGFTPGPL
jgi:hypothetical protein